MILKYIIPFGVKRVGVSAFEKSSLNEVVCSDSTKTIELYAFANTDIKKITFSKMTEKLGGNYVEESEVFEGSKILKRYMCIKNRHWQGCLIRKKLSMMCIKM